MPRSWFLLALTAPIVLACSTVPPDPNSHRAGDELGERYFDTCQPKTSELPRLKDGQAPIYPVARMMAEQDGYAIVEFDIAVDGRTKDVIDVESSHPKFFDHTWIAIRKWQFEPARQDGEAIEVRCRFRQEFTVRFKNRR